MNRPRPAHCIAASGRPRRLALALGLTLATVAAAPAASQAATVGPGTVGGSIAYTAGDGESNQLQVRPGPAGAIAFVDPANTIAASGPCVQITANEAHCTAAPLDVHLGDGDDRATVDVDHDLLLDGGTGDDTLTGGSGDERLNGGSGNDVLDGRLGADVLSGQDGSDTVRYAGRTASVVVNLATAALGEEGQIGEGDTVTPDNESAIGGSGADELSGNAAANVLDGGAGSDTVEGGNGNDSALGGAGHDAVDGGLGNDVVDGGAGNDRVTGGTGADDLRGGAGADTLRARDGHPDSLDCGADGDAADADAVDTVSGCESGAPAPVLAPVTPAAPAATPFSFIYGVFKLPSAPVVLEKGRVTLSVSCPAATPLGRCSGVLSLERFGKQSKQAKASRRTRRFRAGEQSYAVRAGKKTKVRVRLSSVARREVNRSGTARLKVLLRRTKRAKRSTRIGTLKVQASRRTKRQRRPARIAS